VLTRREPNFTGHRGARFEAPENTLPGFRHAITSGLTSIEFDVRMSADGHLVVIHDETLERTTTGRGRVADLTLREIQQADARAQFASWPERCFVPTLVQALDVMRGVPDLMMEIKSDDPQRLEQIVLQAAREVAQRGMLDQVTLTSFDTVALEIAQRVCPRLRRGYIGNWNRRHFLERAVELGCRQADVHHPTANHDVVAEARATGLRVMIWPVNSEEALDNAIALDPDLICTDHPSLLRRLHGSLVA
jgi:glycerophosphoryl diester phosphodiesterase